MEDMKTRLENMVKSSGFKLEDYRIYDDMCVLLLSDEADNEKTIIIDTNFIKLRKPKKLVMFNGKDENFTLPTELYDIDLAYLLSMKNLTEDIGHEAALKILRPPLIKTFHLTDEDVKF